MPFYIYVVLNLAHRSFLTRVKLTYFVLVFNHNRLNRHLHIYLPKLIFFPLQSIGVGRFRIFGGPRFRILGGGQGGGGKFPAGT